MKTKRTHETQARRVCFRGRAAIFTRLEGVDLAVAKGDCIGVIGKNGKGKTTFLNLLAEGPETCMSPHYSYTAEWPSGSRLFESDQEGSAGKDPSPL